MFRGAHLANGNTLISSALGHEEALNNNNNNNNNNNRVWYHPTSGLMQILHFDWLRYYRSIGNSHRVAKFAGFVNLFISYYSQVIFEFIIAFFCPISWVILKQLDRSPSRATGLIVNYLADCRILGRLQLNSSHEILGFGERDNNRSTKGKTSRSRVENQPWRGV